MFFPSQVHIFFLNRIANVCSVQDEEGNYMSASPNFDIKSSISFPAAARISDSKEARSHGEISQTSQWCPICMEGLDSAIIRTVHIGILRIFKPVFNHLNG
jgi:hypothetical protein